MKRLGKVVLGAVMMAGTGIATMGQADAGVRIGIGVGVPAPVYAAPPCAYGPGSCGYYAYNYPVFVGGAWVYGPHYYRWWGGRPWVWWRGGWHTGFRGGWRGAGWHGGWRGGHGHWHR